MNLLPPSPGGSWGEVCCGVAQEKESMQVGERLMMKEYSPDSRDVISCVGSESRGNRELLCAPDLTGRRNRALKTLGRGIRL